MIKISHVIKDVFNEVELDGLVDYSKSSGYKRKGIRPISCYATQTIHIPQDLSKIDMVSEMIVNINKQKWKLELKGEVNSYMHIYDEDRKIPMKNLTFQTHRDSHAKGFHWHYDSMEVTNEITAIIMIEGEDGSLNYIDGNIVPYDFPKGSGVCFPSFVPYNIEGQGIYLTYNVY